MRHATKPKPDVAVAGVPISAIWVLAQVSPRFEVLAASPDRNRLVSEMAELYGSEADGGADPAVRCVIRSTNTLLP